MTRITHGGTTVTPTQVLGYQADREVRNIVHPILGRANPDVSIRPAALRVGTLELGFEGATSEADSAAAVELFSTGSVFAVEESDRVSVEMSFVVAGGTVGRELDDETRDAWVVSVPFQEVTA